MILSSKNINELIDIALKTTSLDDMLFLTKHPSMIITPLNKYLKTS